VRELPLVARYAERYQAHGLSLLKTAPGQKHPAYASWNRPENAIPPNYWRTHPSDGIAALLAPSSLVSIDVDDEAVAEPLMQTFGVDLRELRMSGPCIVGRHYRLMYRRPDVELKHRTVKWPKKEEPRCSSVILELRAGLISDTLPPTIHPSTGKPYRWENPPRNGFPPLPPRLLELWLEWPEFNRQALELCPWAPPPKPALPPRTRMREPGRASVIDVFNAAHDVAEILEQHGYQRRGKRFASPGTEHAAGIVLTDDGRVFCHHAGDPLSSDHAHDAFDIYRLLQHGGNFQSAVKAAAEALGLRQTARCAP
jgi:putative DNA primase/helicase